MVWLPWLAEVKRETHWSSIIYATEQRECSPSCRKMYCGNEHCCNSRQAKVPVRSEERTRCGRDNKENIEVLYTNDEMLLSYTYSAQHLGLWQDRHTHTHTHTHTHEEREREREREIERESSEKRLKYTLLTWLQYIFITNNIMIVTVIFYSLPISYLLLTVAAMHGFLIAMARTQLLMIYKNSSAHTEVHALLQFLAVCISQK